MSERRERVGREKMRALGVRIPETVHATLSDVARRDDRSLNNVIVRCLRECADRYAVQAGGTNGAEGAAAG
jgi:predicted HicB family RNase H-like nuclease